MKEKRSAVDVVYCEVGEGGVVACFLHNNLFRPPVGELEVPSHLNEIDLVRDFVKEFAEKQGCEVEEDPHATGDSFVVFHLFHK